MSIKHIAAAFLISVCTTVSAQQFSCITPAVVKTVKLIFAENVIVGAEQQMALRYSLDRETPLEAFVKGADNLSSALTLQNIRKTALRDDGFPLWCAGEIYLNSAPQYAVPVEYRTRPSDEQKNGFLTQAKFNMPRGAEGFNLLIGLRKALVAEIPEEYRFQPQKTAEQPPPPPPPPRATVQPSFKCSDDYENDFVKRMICASNTLSQLDTDEFALYKKAHEHAKSRLQMYDLWAFENNRGVRMHKRNHCRDEQCLERVYRDWIKDLEALPR